MSFIMLTKQSQDPNIELLNYVYQNAKMGSQSIAQILPKIDNQEFQSVLLDQLSQYQNIVSQASNMLSNFNASPKECMMDKLSSKAGIAFNTMTNTSTSHIAEMIINGNTMGIIDITKKINQAENCSQDVCNLCNDLVEIEEQNTDNMKQFL